VIKARKKYHIKYPNLYSSRSIEGEDVANKFNSIQRAH